jgi:polyhydroxyalkanoate synthesis regulator protein
LQGLFARYLEQALDVFARQQQQVRESFGEHPFEAMTRVTQRNMELWADMQKEFLRAAGFDPAGKDDKGRKPEE